MGASGRIADRDLARRIGFAAVAIPMALLVVWYGGPALTLLLAAAAALGTRELFDLAERHGVRPARTWGLLSAAAVAPVTYAAMSAPGARAAVQAGWPYVAALWLMGLMTWALAARHPEDRPLAAMGITLLAVAYTGGLPAFLLAIRHSSYGLRSWAGAWLVFYPLVVTWICDTAAMFGGRAFGGPKLAPRVSPGKTRSGGLAGVVGSLLVAPLFAFAVLPRVGLEIPLSHLLLVAGVLGIIGQIGDLAESLIKREAGVKDSSHLIPGHGGVLDRLDSLYFVVPTAAALYRMLGII